MTSNLTYWPRNDYSGNQYDPISAGSFENSQPKSAGNAIVNSFKLDPGVVLILTSSNANPYQVEGINVSNLVNAMGGYGRQVDWVSDGVNNPFGYNFSPGQYLVNSGAENYAFQVKVSPVGKTGSFSTPSGSWAPYPRRNDPLIMNNTLPNGFRFQSRYLVDQSKSSDTFYFYYRLDYCCVIIPTVQLYKNCANSRYLGDPDCDVYYAKNCLTATQMASPNCQNFCSNKPTQCQTGYANYCSVLDNVVNPFCSTWCKNNRAACDPLMINYCSRHANNTEVCGCINTQSLTGLAKLLNYYGQQYFVHCNAQSCTSEKAYKTSTMIAKACPNSNVCIQNLNLSALDIQLGNVSQTCSITDKTDDSNSGGNPVSDGSDINTIIQQYILQYAPYAIGIIAVIVVLLLVAIFRPRRR